jgi:hypothetical protein
MKIHYLGRSVGCYQDESGFYMRIKIPEFPKQECEIPITQEQFHKIKFGEINLTLEVE